LRGRFVEAFPRGSFDGEIDTADGKSFGGAERPTSATRAPADIATCPSTRPSAPKPPVTTTHLPCSRDCIRSLLSYQAAG
jgi:hypothetical protein